MNLHQRGTELINQLKDHVLEVLQSHPEAGSGGEGVLQDEIARRAGLHTMGTVELDHTCREMLRVLYKEGRIEPVDNKEGSAKKPRWRLTQE